MCTCALSAYLVLCIDLLLFISFRIFLFNDVFFYFFFLLYFFLFIFFFFSSRRRHTRCLSDWSSDVCSSDLLHRRGPLGAPRWPRRPPPVPHAAPDSARPPPAGSGSCLPLPACPASRSPDRKSVV